MADSGVHIFSSRPRLQTFPEELAASTLAATLQPFHFLIRVPALLFLATLSIFVFRPPDLELHHLDRVAQTKAALAMVGVGTHGGPIAFFALHTSHSAL